ncbi:MAG: 4Fe-4S binding protein [Planctomycetia bacterium]|nr:4Fe-4S binding protein [Planctomycetia bacterium]
MFRIVRILLAIGLLVSLTFYFLDFNDLAPAILSKLATIQLVPAILAGNAVIFGGLILVAFLFGRIYCSIICPLGILQDCIARISKWFRPKKKNNYHYRRNNWVLRWTVLSLTVILFWLKFPLLTLLEPYSIFGRIITNVFQPIYLFGNNLLCSLFLSFGSYRFYYIDIVPVSWIVLSISLISFGLIAVMACFWGRLYCHSICPVGTFFGFIARYSLFKIRIDSQKCIQCGLCSKVCKSSCINEKERTIDSSRCVDCFNCLTECRRKAISYSFFTKSGKKTISNETKTNGSKNEVSVQTDESKRTFLIALTTIAATSLPKTASVVPHTKDEYGLIPFKREQPISPPGSLSHENLQQQCTACHLCVSKCPSNVLKPALLEYGLQGLLQPRMDFEHGFCNYDCVVCSEVCPNKAITTLSKKEKHRVQPGHVVFIKENCIVHAKETSCGACSEHCPTQAVAMVPYKDNLTIPLINPDLCVGCGACEYICPARPYRAIYVEGNTIHREAEIVQEEEKKIIDDIDFGF